MQTPSKGKGWKDRGIAKVCRNRGHESELLYLLELKALANALDVTPNLPVLYGNCFRLSRRARRIYEVGEMFRTNRRARILGRQGLEPP
jgi:hypothetical protein